MIPEFHVVIPARFESTRLPGKLLMDLNGKTVIERVYHQALASNAASVTIATDHDAIFEVAKAFGADVLMTSVTHQTGTDRIAEVSVKLGFKSDTIIVNVQGDEPYISPLLITQVATSLALSTAPVATLCWPIEKIEQCCNPNVVKVVRDCHHHALYFSRSVIPFHRDNSQSLEHLFYHIGLYAYRAAFLQAFVTWPPCALEVAESLEQLRILWAGYKITVDKASVAPMQDINTSEDLERAREIIAHAPNLLAS